MDKKYNEKKTRTRYLCVSTRSMVLYSFVVVFFFGLKQIKHSGTTKHSHNEGFPRMCRDYTNLKAQHAAQLTQKFLELP